MYTSWNAATVVIAFLAFNPPAKGQDDAGGASAGICPTSGDCCSPHGGGGCENTACCNTVCNADSVCCGSFWDQDCVNLAGILCGDLCDPCPGTGDCCTAHDSAACNDAACCDLVCTQSSFCCDGVWTQACVDLAGILCGDLCDPCPGAGSCCLSGEGKGCSDEPCCLLLCQEDSYCCDVEWDSLCAAEAFWLCAPLCDEPCPAEGDCCSAHAGGGCREASCCAAVCSVDPTCCSEAWNASCVDLALQHCNELCGGACPGAETCCETHASSGCSDTACCDLVCAQDAFCCFLGWGFDCVSAAEDLCGDLCLAPPSCPGIGDCCTSHAGSGCVDEACCRRVCDQAPTCCLGPWSSTCADLAADFCGLSCTCPGGAGDYDHNFRVDLRDFGDFQRCFSGPGPTKVAPACVCGDAANNGDVDEADVRAFVNRMTGP